MPSRRTESSLAHKIRGRKCDVSVRRLKRLSGRNAHLIAWGEVQRARGVPDALLMLAQQLAQAAGVLPDAIALAHSPRVRELGPSPAPEVWEQCYRRGDRLFERLGNTFVPSPPMDAAAWTGSPEMGLGTLARCFVVQVREAQRSSSELIRTILRDLDASDEWERVWAEWQAAQDEAWAAHLEELREDEPPLADDDTFNTPEVQFFFRVWWPCWAVYGVSAADLFAAAERGDVQAFEKLARIDERLLQIPRINDQWERWKLDGNREARRIVSTALGDEPLTTTVREQKLRTIALLFDLSRRFATWPFHPIVLLRLDDLRALFDAVACDQGRLSDEDLPESDEAFRKAVQRAQREQSPEAWDIL